MGGWQTQAGLAECAEQKKWGVFDSLAVVATGHLIIVRAIVRHRRCCPLPTISTAFQFQV
jgi:hypothetical protein